MSLLKKAMNFLNAPRILHIITQKTWFIGNYIPCVGDNNIYRQGIAQCIYLYIYASIVLLDDSPDIVYGL